MAESVDEKYFDELAQTIIDGEEEDCLRVINEGLARGVDPLDAVEKGLAKGINKIGDDFAEEIVFLPELIMAADAMKSGMRIYIGIYSLSLQAENKIPTCKTQV